MRRQGVQLHTLFVEPSPDAEYPPLLAALAHDSMGVRMRATVVDAEAGILDVHVVSNAANWALSKLDVAAMWARHVSANCGNTMAQPTGQVCGIVVPGGQLVPATSQHDSCTSASKQSKVWPLQKVPHEPGG